LQTKSTFKRRLCLAVAAALFVSGNAIAFKPKEEFGHIGITVWGARQIAVPTSSGSLTFTFSAIEEMRTADAAVDDLNGEFWSPGAHCDNEMLPACSQRILKLKNEAIAALQATPRDGKRARNAIGRALHTLQDFYAHSNWVSSPGLSHTGFNPILGRGIQPALQPTQMACLDDDDQITLAGYGLTQATTGYFSLNPLADAPAGKCQHGIDYLVAGINKDQPNRPFFIPARAAAVAATKDFLQQIIDAVKSDEDAVRTLMGVHPSVGFVVDDTGSMGRYINGVRGSIYTLGAEAAADPTNAPDRFLLQTFNDPTVGYPWTYASYPELMTGVNAINPHEGGDCPELAMAGLISATRAIRSGSTLYVYTDASAKDSYRAHEAGALAISKHVSINYVVSGSCSPIDPAYYETASRTGGTLMLAYNTELATPMLRATSSPNSRLLFSAYDTLAGDVRRYRVNVDSAASKLTLLVGTDDIQNIRLLDPDGVDVTHDTAVTKLVDFYSGATVNVDTPKAGEWLFEFKGTGKTITTAYVSSPIVLHEVTPVAESGRLAHTGLFPINGLPVLGEPGLVEATIEGAEAQQLEVRKLDGALVSSQAFLPEQSEEVTEGVHKYRVPVTLDGTPVRFFLRGRDAGGVAFLRAYPTAYSAQPIRVNIEDRAFQLEPGQSRSINFVIDNFGAESDFDFQVDGTPGVVDPSFNPPLLHIAAGARATIAVPVSIPANTELEEISLLGTVVDNADTSHYNTHLAKFVVDSGDSDGDGVPDDVDQCPASNLEPTVTIDACDSGVANHQFPEGCTISDETATLRSAARNHGQFVSAVSDYTRELAGLGVIENKDRGSIVSCAAKSTSP
jgi:hypothetical protein